MLGGLVLELRHTAGFTETGDAVQDPRQLCVLGNLTLHEQRRPIRIDPHRKELSDRNLGATTQFLRVLRHRDGVKIRNEVESVEIVLQRNPLLQRTQVIAEVERIRRRLDSGKHARLCGGLLFCRGRHGSDLFTSGNQCSGVVPG